MAKVYFKNEDCFTTMSNMKKVGYKVNMILTSPPYASSRNVKTQKAIDTYNRRYDVYQDNMNEEEYLEWSVNLFNNFDDILEENGIIVYNISYGSEFPNAYFKLPSLIIDKTNFMIGDQMIWHKSCALPNNVGNKLTRICEPIFIICRKNEYKTFQINKKVKSVRKDTGQKYYENIFNYIKAPNNDGACKLNKATYSSDMCLQILNIYALPNNIIYDPFMGTGTTAIACQKFNQNNDMICIGSELSAAQVEYSRQRYQNLKEEQKQLTISFVEI